MGASLTVSGLLPQGGFVIFVVCCAVMGLSVPFYSDVQTALFQEKIKHEQVHTPSVDFLFVYSTFPPANCSLNLEKSI